MPEATGPFDLVEQLVRDLVAQRQAGTITPQQFDERFERSRSVQAAGAWWSVAADATTWFRYDGTAWQPASRPRAQAQPRAASTPSGSLAVHRELRGHEGDVNSVSVSADCARLVTAGHDGSIRVWDLLSGAQIAVQWVAPPVRFVRWLHADRHVLYASTYQGSLRVWDTVTQEHYSVLDGAHSDIAALSADGRVLAATDDEKLHLYDLGNLRELVSLTPADTPMAIAVAPDGTRAAATSFGLIEVWEVGNWAKSARLGSADVYNDLAFSPDGTRLLGGGSSLVVWTVGPMPTKVELPDQPGNVWCVGWLNGNTVVSGSSVLGWDQDMIDEAGGADRTVRTWSVSAKSELRRSAQLPSDVAAMACSADGRWIAAATSDSSVTTWDTAG
jgi:WD40 repeat protein